ncbi:40S small subunit ribosomal protein eS25 (rpS25) [Andalucia godoyi]|uniref:40S ribosomal protein S25 n=1 Tax=Andalucia godoyi TaxID=505711 RepID=A0A8K0AJK2_ANDGO|nr:40S small subunit ribosomal protein eS25 (rpS25) [Andalucia godoyi]|eukprot:ANDGO_07024.mRNA.1 40S small subunit ribosomal protein eS25 (rpS25)
MAVKEQKSKAAKALAAQKSNRGKKKKWSKQTLKEKANHFVILTPEQLKKFVSEGSKYKSITPSVLVDRLKVNASIARRLIHNMEAEGLIKSVIKHNSQLCYTRAGAA